MAAFNSQSMVQAAEPFNEQFESLESSWQVHSGTQHKIDFEQQRAELAGRSGRGELVRLESSTEGGTVRLSHKLPPARVLDELTGSLWLRSPHVGWRLSLEVTLPGVHDSETSSPLTFMVPGDSYSEAGAWQQLTCRTAQQAIQQQMALLRARQVELSDMGPMHVQRIWLVGHLPKGTTVLHLDDLQLGPIVPADVSVEDKQPVETAPTLPNVEFRLDRLLIDGRPFFPRIVPYHGEPPELLRELGFNVVWIPDLNDTKLIRRCWEQGLWVTATPPRPTDDNGRPLQSGSAGLVPFGPGVDPVLFWMLGTRIPGDHRQDLEHWIEQIEFADRRRSRPIAADVAFAEHLYSRKLAMMGISRHGLQSTMSFQDYRQWLQDRRSLARPGTFCWTWLQTEPSSHVVQALSGADEAPHLEPEQIRLQAYAALASGCRGLGFWTATPLDGTRPSDVERRLAIRRLNLELKLLEPWLATAGSAQQISCKVASPVMAPNRRNLPFGTNLANSVEREAQLRTLASDTRRRQRLEQELTAFVLRTEFGLLVIPLWLEEHSQFVPAQSAIQNLELIIPGSEQAAAAFEITTTSLRTVRSERVPGGLKAELPTLDEVGFLWVTSDLALVDRVRNRMNLVQADSARVLVDLAAVKLDRIGLIDQQLQTIAPAQPDAPQKLGTAKIRLERAQSALDLQDYASAAQRASEVLQLTRLLQRDHWDAAIAHLTSPVSSPFTLCYQTLPAHWDLISRFGASRERSSKNLLPSGEFEDFDTLVAEQWQNVQRAPEIIQTSAALFPTGRKSRYALRLECLPQKPAQSPLILDEPPVTVTTPPVPVRVGQILHVSGWVKLTSPVSGSRDGLLVYDSLLGRNGAIRFRDGDQWTRFDMLRVVPTSGDFTLTMSLTGMGSALIDDLQVVPHDPVDAVESAPASNQIQQTSGSLFDRFPKLPRLMPLRSAD